MSGIGLKGDWTPPPLFTIPRNNTTPLRASSSPSALEFTPFSASANSTPLRTSSSGSPWTSPRSGQSGKAVMGDLVGDSFEHGLGSQFNNVFGSLSLRPQPPQPQPQPQAVGRQTPSPTPPGFERSSNKGVPTWAATPASSNAGNRANVVCNECGVNPRSTILYCGHAFCLGCAQTMETLDYLGAVQVRE